MNNLEVNRSTLKVLDLFSGIGGFSLGLERTGGFETVAFCEIDAKARKVLQKHWKDVPIYEDVTKLKGEQLGTIDVICGGFPCQDISLAGRGAGLEGARSGLWWEFHRLIKEIKPKWVIAENVSALRSRGLDTVLRSLAEIGYDAEWHCIPASAVGAPHQRDRIWIVAYPQLHGFFTAEIAGSIRETVSKEQERQNNALDVEKTSVLSSSDTDVSDSLCERLERQRAVTGRVSEAYKNLGDSCGWDVEPDVGRMVNGLPNRVDRIKQLGNAVVPQIPEFIGYSILNRG